MSLRKGSSQTEKYIFKTFKHVNLDWPFNVWHFFEHPIVAGVVNFFTNFWLPVRSVALELPARQSRFRLDYKGNILDFDRMTDEEIRAYESDEHEQERQSQPGRRHRNHETIRCRYLSICDKAKIIESRKRIRSGSKLVPKALKYSTARRSPEGWCSDEINNNYWTQNGRPSFADSGNSREFHPNPDGKLVLYIHGAFQVYSLTD